MTTPLTFQVDVSRQYKNKTGKGKENYSFKTETHTPETFVKRVVKAGYPYTMVHQKLSPQQSGGIRRNPRLKTPKHTENFVSRQELTGDDDAQRPGVVDFWLHDPFFAQYGYAFVESVNSQPEAEKGHPTIIFDRPIRDPGEYKERAKAFVWYYSHRPGLDSGIHNADRTIYNAVGARIHPLGNICPLAVFDREILEPYRAELRRLAEEQESRRPSRSDPTTRPDDNTISGYLDRCLEGIFNYVASQTKNRHDAILWAGTKTAEYQAAAWTDGYNFGDLEARLLAACRDNGYTRLYDDNEILRNFHDGQSFGTNPAPMPDLGNRTNASGPRGRALQPYELSDDARAEKERIRAESAAKREAKAAAKQEAGEARAAELERRWQAGNVIPFIDDLAVDPDCVERLRGTFTNASKWRDYCLAHWPDIDAEEQRQIKLAENREERPHRCGEYHKKILPNGKVHISRWTCGVCPDCLKRGLWTYRRALNEIQGIPTGEILPLEVLEADDLSPSDEAPRENAPPLAQVKGDLSLILIRGDQERLKYARRLRIDGIAYRCLPVTIEGEVAYDFIVNDDRGDPLNVLATDERIALWIKGAKNKNASGSLLPSLDKLQKRYREALPYEVVMPELDDAGQPVDPDIVCLDLPDIGTNAKLPAVAVDFEVHDLDSLQAALLEIHRQQFKILNKRKDVKFGVYIRKKFYTRNSTLPAMLAEFNARQEAIKAKKKLLPD